MTISQAWWIISTRPSFSTATTCLGFAFGGKGELKDVLQFLERAADSFNTEEIPEERLDDVPSHEDLVEIEVIIISSKPCSG